MTAMARIVARRVPRYGDGGPLKGALDRVGSY